MRIFTTSLFVTVLINHIQGIKRCPAKCSCEERSIILCNDSGLSTMPKRISSHVEQLQADNNSITELSSRMLINGFALQKMILSRNMIRRLQLNNFRNTPSLSFLDLSRNNITAVPDDAFFGLKNLKTLKLNSNQISRIFPLAFKHLDLLRELILSNNFIETIPDSLLSFQPNLETLRLDGNQITVIPQGVFRSLTKLTVLELSRNRIHRISVDDFNGLISLESLHLSHNLVKVLDEQFPRTNQTCQPKSVGKQSSPEAAAPVQRGVFSSLGELRTLDVRDNLLKSVTFDTFHTLHHLRILSLEGNHWRCDCFLKQTTESLRSGGVSINAITCSEPKSIQGRSFNELSYDDLSRLEQSANRSSQLSPPGNVTRNISTWQFTPKSQSHSTEETPLHVDLSVIEIVGRPPNDPVTHPSKLGSGEERQSRRSPIRSIQTDPIAVTTSYDLSRHGNGRGKGVNKRKKIIRSYLTTQPLLNDVITAANNIKSRSDSGNDNGNETAIIHEPRPKISSKEKDNGTWIIAIAVVCSMLTLTMCVGLALQRITKKRKNSMNRKHGRSKFSARSISNPLLYDTHFARRPLPRAPSFTKRQRRRSQTAEIRWTSGGVYGIGGKTSFISSKNHRGAGNDKARKTSQTSQQSDSKSSIVYSYADDASQASQKTETKRLRLPALPCGDLESRHIGRHVNKYNFNAADETRKKTEQNCRKRRRTQENRRLQRRNAASSSASAETTTVGLSPPPPPPPKRNESSRARCRELIEHNERLRQNCPEYYEIDQIPTNRRNSTDFKRSALFQLSTQKTLKSSRTDDEAGVSDHREVRDESSFQRISRRGEKVASNGNGFLNDTVDYFPGIFPLNGSLARSARRIKSNKTNRRSHFKKQSGVNHFQSYIPLNLLNRAKSADVSQDFESNRYDKLVFSLGDHESRNSTVLAPELRHGNGFVKNRGNIPYADRSRCHDDICFESAEDDFVFSYPVLGLQKAETRGLFGSDQHILDALREQDLGRYKPRQNSAPSRWENLTLPLSEISTDEDETYEVFEADSKIPSFGTQSTVSDQTPESREDVFVYSMAGEATGTVPKITINGETESGYETVKCDIRQKTTSTSDYDESPQEYHHLQFMYSGILSSGHAHRKELTHDEEEIDLTKLIESLHPGKHRMHKPKAPKPRKNRIHYYSINSKESHDENHNSCAERMFELDKVSRMPPSDENEHIQEEQACGLETSSSCGGDKKPVSSGQIFYQSREREIYLKALRNQENGEMRE